MCKDLVILLLIRGFSNKFSVWKEWITIALKKRLSFDELVQENRKQILQDESVLEKIEQNIETKMHNSLGNKSTK